MSFGVQPELLEEVARLESAQNEAIRLAQSKPNALGVVLHRYGVCLVFCCVFLVFDSDIISVVGVILTLVLCCS